MKKIVLLFGTGLLAVLSMLAAPASAQGATGTVTVIHGIPGLTVDVYVNDKLTLEDFAPDTVTAPLELPAGTYQIAIRPANAAADSAAVLAGSATLPAGANASIVAHLDASGQPRLTVFVNDTSALAAGNRAPRGPSHRSSTRGRRARERKACVHEPHEPESGNGRSARRHDQRHCRRGRDDHSGDRTGRPEPSRGNRHRRVRGRLARRQEPAHARPKHPGEHDACSDDRARSAERWTAPQDW